MIRRWRKEEKKKKEEGKGWWWEFYENDSNATSETKSTFIPFISEELVVVASFLGGSKERYNVSRLPKISS